MAPKTANEKILDKIVFHSALLEQLKNEQSDKAIKFINDDILPDVKGQIAKRLSKIKSRGHNVSLESLKGLKSLKSDLEKIVGSSKKKITQQLKSNLLDFADTEVDFVTQELELLVPEISLDRPPIAVLQNVISNQTFLGNKLSKWTDNWGKSVSNKVQKQVSIGLAQGEGIKPIVGRVNDFVDKPSKNQIEAVVRTSMTHVSTSAREEVFKANEDIIKEIYIVATLDFRTTVICMFYDSQRFPVGEGPRPPFHMSCRSTIAPVIRSAEEIGVKIGSPKLRASLNGEVPAKLTYNDWLKMQSVENQNKVLGPARAKLFRAGKIKANQFVNNRAKKLTLKELRTIEELPAKSKLKVLTPLEKAQKKFDEALKELDNPKSKFVSRILTTDLPSKEFKQVAQSVRDENIKIVKKDISKLTLDQLTKRSDKSSEKLDNALRALRKIVRDPESTKQQRQVALLAKNKARDENSVTTELLLKKQEEARKKQEEAKKAAEDNIIKTIAKGKEGLPNLHSRPGDLKDLPEPVEGEIKEVAQRRWVEALSPRYRELVENWKVGAFSRRQIPQSVVNEIAATLEIPNRVKEQLALDGDTLEKVLGLRICSMNSVGNNTLRRAATEQGLTDQDLIDLYNVDRDMSQRIVLKELMTLDEFNTNGTKELLRKNIEKTAKGLERIFEPAPVTEKEVFRGIPLLDRDEFENGFGKIGYIFTRRSSIDSYADRFNSAKDFTAIGSRDLTKVSVILRLKKDGRVVDLDSLIHGTFSGENEVFLRNKSLQVVGRKQIRTVENGGDLYLIDLVVVDTPK